MPFSFLPAIKKCHCYVRRRELKGIGRKKYKNNTQSLVLFHYFAFSAIQLCVSFWGVSMILEGNLGDIGNQWYLELNFGGLKLVNLYWTSLARRLYQGVARNCF